VSTDGAPSRSRRGDAGTTIALLVALVAALLPLLSVIAPGTWTVLCIAGPAALLLAGYLSRRWGVPAVAVTLIEVALWILGTTAVFFSDVAWLAVLPTLEAIERVPLLLEEAVAAITVGVAPLEATPAVTFLVVGSVGLLVIALDHVVLTARMPLLATVAFMAVWLIPSLAIRSEVDVWAFVLLAAAMLWLIRSDTRSRVRSTSAPSPASGVGVVSAVIATVAIVVAVVAAPTLPQSAATGGVVSGTTIDASLNLGDDLRRPSEVPVVRTWGDSPTPPYLRVATLTRLDGDSWRPDRGRSVTLDEWDGAAPETAEDIRVVEYRTQVEVLDLASATLPVPYPATAIEGVDGAEWVVTPDNRTVRSTGVAAQGQQYEVATTVSRPSLEQARESQATSGGARFASALELPLGMPENIARLAEEVTVDADNDYDRLLALQSWFRGTSFDYSLDAPVEEGFDGSGADAIGDSLEVRSGYCVHFASAFALMARTLDMPSRVVVGFLPGAPTGETADDERVYEATTAQLHAWPEVRFEGIGWVAFEPTKSLGSAQRFIAEDIDPSAPEPSASPAPSASASPSATAGPRADERDPESGAVAGGIDPSKLLPTLGLILGIAALIAAPALARRIRAASRTARVQGGSAGTAWRMVQDSALDLGIEVPAAESPRAFAARLTTEHGADPTALGRLTAAVERASYAAPNERGRPAGESLMADAASVHRSLREAVSPGRRLAATVLPRSLIVRPGSTFAAATAANA